MAGLCGVIGSDQHAKRVAKALEWTGEETTTVFEGDSVGVIGSYVSPDEANQPVSVDGDSLLWVWGSVFGFEKPKGYMPREMNEKSTAAYCADLYEEHELAFVSGLNGDFVGILYDCDEGRVSVFTDRLGLRDTYYVQPTEETLVFSTAIQSLSRHPQVTPAFDSEYVAEYFGCHYRTFGLKTPLRETYLFPPGAITTVDSGSMAVETEQYWTPSYDPVDRPFSDFLDEFTRRFEAAVTERLRPDRRYGLLLSGGVDSRAVLAAVDSHTRDRVTAYHGAGWMSREARTAERVAHAAGVDFELLTRGPDYHEQALTRNPALSNFVGTFEQAHLEGFMDEIRGDVDEMLTASFADSNFKGHSFPQHSVEVGPLGTVQLPGFKSMDSVARYVDFWTTDPPSYLDSVRDPETVFRSEIRKTDDGIDHHGVTYKSPMGLFTCGMLTPRTNGSVLFMLQSLRQHVPAWSPFVDNRLVDLYLSMPTKYFARQNVVLQTIQRLDPDLANVPYANTGLPPRYPFAAHLVGEHAVKFADKYLPFNDPPAQYLSNGPWPDIPELIREQSFVADAIEENEDAIRELPFLNWDGVQECYREHETHKCNDRALYGLLTLLEMPVTRRIIDADL